MARGPHRDPLLTRKELLRVLGGGYLSLVSDYYWIQTIQATGVANTAEEYRDVYFYADTATELDPKFRYVYVFAGSAIPYNTGREKWVNTEESTSLLRKGKAAIPDDILIRILLAFNLSYYHEKYHEAADLLTETSRMPKAPSYLSSLATRLYAQAENFDGGLALAMSLAQSASDPQTREAFKRRTQEILLERELTRVDKAIDQYKSKENHSPIDLRALIDSHYLTPPPRDPLGGEIFIGSDGRASSTSIKHRLEVYGKVRRDGSGN